MHPLLKENSIQHALSAITIMDFQQHKPYIGKPYIGSTETPFRARFNNYRSAQRNFEKGKKVKQKSIHIHFSEEGHYGEKDWVITLIHSAENVEELRKNNQFGNMNLIPSSH